MRFTAEYRPASDTWLVCDEHWDGRAVGATLSEAFDKWCRSMDLFAAKVGELDVQNVPAGIQYLLRGKFGGPTDV